MAFRNNPPLPLQTQFSRGHLVPVRFNGGFFSSPTKKHTYCVTQSTRAVDFYSRYQQCIYETNFASYSLHHGPPRMKIWDGLHLTITNRHKCLKKNWLVVGTRFNDFTAKRPLQEKKNIPVLRSMDIFITRKTFNAFAQWHVYFSLGNFWSLGKHSGAKFNISLRAS